MKNLLKSKSWVKIGLGAALSLSLVAAFTVFSILYHYGEWPVAITIAPSYTVYFTEDISPRLWVHEAVHRRQWKERGTLKMIPYIFDFKHRSLVEAEAIAASMCIDTKVVQLDFPAKSYSNDKFIHISHTDFHSVLNGGLNCGHLLRDLPRELPPEVTQTGTLVDQAALFSFFRTYGSSHEALTYWRRTQGIRTYIKN